MRAGAQVGRRGSGEGSIYQRNDGRWAATLSLGYEGARRRRKTFYGRTRAEVARKLREASARHDTGMPTATSSPRVAEASKSGTATVSK